MLISSVVLTNVVPRQYRMAKCNYIYYETLYIIFQIKPLICVKLFYDLFNLLSFNISQINIFSFIEIML